MFDKLKNLFGMKEKGLRSEPPSEVPPKQKKLRRKKEPSTLTPKQIASANGEPYVNIVTMEIDPNDVNNGAFELDWNDKFVVNLIKAGYKYREDDTDQIIVERWFQTVCRNIALEIYEQEQADPTNRDLRVIRSRDIGNGRTEVS